MKDIEIRNVTEADLPYLFKICLETGDNGKDASCNFYNPYLLGHYYAAPYALFSKGFSFVAVDKQTGIPEGYILGCEDTMAFYEKRNEYLKPLRNQVENNTENKTSAEENIKSTILAAITENQTQKNYTSAEEEYWVKEYPAHLHIDLLPSLQGHGLGHKIMQIFLENLRVKGVKGVHLGVGGENKKACAFYEREGFEILQQVDWGFWLGMKL